MTTAHERLKSKLAGARAGFGWKPKDGDNPVFILPPASKYVDNLDQLEDLAFEFKAHYFRIEGQQGEASRCLTDARGEKCPACMMHRQHANAADPALKEMAKSIRQADSYIFNMLDLNDVQKGVQRWAANWTCWTSIMEIASNPAWGFVYDPRDGVPFVVTFTPAAKSRTKNNSYKVMPQPPPRITVYDILMANPAGLAALDGIEDAAMETKSAEEIITLLDLMGFPPLPGTAATPVRGAQPLSPLAPRPVAPAMAPLAAAPMPVARPVASAAAPQPVAPRPMVASASTPQPAPARVVSHAGTAQPATLTEAVAIGLGATVHYDPGPSYVEKLPADQRPDGAPRCYGDYDPGVHQCQPCPVRSDCQMKVLGVA